MSLQLTVDELAKSLEKHIDMANEQDIDVSSDGRDIARINVVFTPKMEVWEELKKLRGLLPADTELDQLRTERILK